MNSSLAFANDTMRTICHAAYRESIAIAQEKGCFPDFDRERYLEAPFIRGLPADIRDGIARHGIRNSHLLAIAPTGTTSLLAGNVSSGIEPVFASDYRRTVLEATARCGTSSSLTMLSSSGASTSAKPPPRRMSWSLPRHCPSMHTWRCRPHCKLSSTTRSQRRSTCLKIRRLPSLHRFTASPTKRA